MTIIKLKFIIVNEKFNLTAPLEAKKGEIEYMAQTLNADAIGRRLKALRGDRKQNAVAREMGISPMCLSLYERGERIPRDKVKVIMANYYGKTVEQIFFT